MLSAPFVPSASRPTTPGGTKPTAEDTAAASSGAMSDSKFVGLLSSASVMNGSISKGRQSVWAALDRLRPSGKPRTDDQNTEEGRPESVMIYGPLIPEAGSQVELADSQTVEVDEDGARVAPLEPPSATSAEPSQEDKVKKGKLSWPWSKGTSQEKKPREVKVWIPSASQISLQATWWGYRIYLPPPVLDVLSSKQLEAAKRAAMITGSLQFFLRSLPVAVFPPQFRGAAMILQRLAPSISYIGAFLAWSWESIKGFDKGLSDLCVGPLLMWLTN
jgi:hypothetical protein